MKRLLVAFIGTLFAISGALICINTNAAAESKGIQFQNVKLVWAEHYGGSDHIFYSALSEGKWSPKVKISDGNENNVKPAIITDKNGTTWIVWTSIDSREQTSQLMFSRLDDETWSVPETIETGLSTNTAASLASDQDDVVWLVWAGYDGQDDDIYFSRWRENQWDAPEIVNEDNANPDLLPVVGVEKGGNIWVIWTGFDGESYRSYKSRWNGDVWDAPEKSADNREIQRILSDKVYFFNDFPSFLKNRNTASFYLGKGEVQSIPLSQKR